jgi:hypothetical protein
MGCQYNKCCSRTNRSRRGSSEHAKVEHLAENVGISKIPTTTSSMQNWINLINESVHTADDVDIGDIEAVSKDLLL